MICSCRPGEDSSGGVVHVAGDTSEGPGTPISNKSIFRALPSSVIPCRWMRACIGHLDPSTGGRGIRDGTWLRGHWQDEELSTGSPSDLLIRYQTTSRSP